MRTNRLLRLWADDKPAINGWLQIPTSYSAELMAHQGWDSLTVDMQHGVVDYQNAVAMFTAIATTEVVPMARVPWLEPGIIMKTLDAGAFGIICPMINSREECERFVAAVNYPPAGNRSFGPIRQLLYSGSDYWKYANKETLAIAMVETKQAVDNLDDILSVEGLDAVYVGPADLALSLGCTPKLDHEEKPVTEALKHIIAKAKEHNIIAGVQNSSSAYVRKMSKLGFRLLTLGGSDARIMAAGAKQLLDEVRDTGGTGSAVSQVY